MSDLIFIGIDRAGLEEAQRDRDRHAERLTAELFWKHTGEAPEDFKRQATRAVKKAMQCDREWPTCEK